MACALDVLVRLAGHVAGVPVQPALNRRASPSSAFFTRSRAGSLSSQPCSEKCRRQASRALTAAVVVVIVVCHFSLPPPDVFEGLDQLRPTSPRTPHVAAMASAFLRSLGVQDRLLDRVLAGAAANWNDFRAWSIAPSVGLISLP